MKAKQEIATNLSLLSNIKILKNQWIKKTLEHIILTLEKCIAKCLKALEEFLENTSHDVKWPSIITTMNPFADLFSVYKALF